MTQKAVCTFSPLLKSQSTISTMIAASYLRSRMYEITCSFVFLVNFIDNLFQECLFSVRRLKERIKTGSIRSISYLFVDFMCSIGKINEQTYRKFTSVNIYFGVEVRFRNSDFRIQQNPSLQNPETLHMQSPRCSICITYTAAEAEIIKYLCEGDNAQVQSRTTVPDVLFRDCRINSVVFEFRLQYSHHGL